MVNHSPTRTTPQSQETGSHQMEIPPPAEPVRQDNHNLEQQTCIAAASVKIPQFWKENPQLWFLQVESLFTLAGITRDETKFVHLVAKLDESILQFVSDIILSQTIVGKYEALKTRLIGNFQESEEVKLRKLLGGLQIGDMKPSHFLLKIKNLGGCQVSPNIIKSIFMEQLPDQTKAILAISQIEDLSKLAEQADKIHEITAPQISAVSTSKNDTTLLDKINELQVQIEELRSDRSRRGNRSQSNRRSRSKSSVSKDKPFCWYHHKFGSNAKKCTKPCQYSDPKN